MNVPPNDVPVGVDFDEIRDYDFDPGCIFWVNDPDSRLDRRVMLVVYKCDSSVACLSFCAQPPNRHGHWRVHDRGRRRRQRQMPHASTLEIVLQNEDEQRFNVSPAIWVNTAEIWNVPWEVEVAILGHATSATLYALGKAMQNQFRQRMNSMHRSRAARVNLSTRFRGGHGTRRRVMVDDEGAWADYRPAARNRRW